jgi:FAD/FMN-containing dehydrogenase
MTRLTSGWGNYPVVESEVLGFSNEEELRERLAREGVIAQGLLRSYGDSALSERAITTSSYNRFLSFQPETGTLICESGVSLSDILEVFLPRGWFLPVTPGTKFVTIGGAIASDVHGKNHHKSGSFCNHISSMDVMLPSGEVLTCSHDTNPGLFRATCGGMGLTGVILRASLRLIPVKSAHIKQETVKTKDLLHIMEMFESSVDWTYSMAWIDCLSSGRALGRSIMMRGEHAGEGDLALPKKQKLSVPVYFPGFVLNNLSVRAFNMLYYTKAPAGTAGGIVDYDSFFYPLDAIGNWNRIYGRRGFTQYQFVLPIEASREGMKKMLNKIAASGMGSFLAVLKLFGAQEGLMSFPMEGYTLALDFPMKRGLLQLLDELDRMVVDYGGRLYLTKDARMAAETFRASYRNLDEFLALREKYDPGGKMSSLQSRRLGI